MKKSFSVFYWCNFNVLVSFMEKVSVRFQILDSLIWFLSAENCRLKTWWQSHWKLNDWNHLFQRSYHLEVKRDIQVCFSFICKRMLCYVSRYNVLFSNNLFYFGRDFYPNFVSILTFISSLVYFAGKNIFIVILTYGKTYRYRCNKFYW